MKIKNCKSKISSRGITMVEIVLVVFIILLFSFIIVSNFPRLLRRNALSRATYKIAQDLRMVEGLGISGVRLSNINGTEIETIKGYGFYASSSSATYTLYADIAPTVYGEGNKVFDSSASKTCDRYNFPRDTGDCIIYRVNVTDENPSLYIAGIKNFDDTDITGSSASVNFRPPDPIVEITDNLGNTYPGIKIILQNTDGFTRTVWVNSSGLINVE